MEDPQKLKIELHRMNDNSASGAISKEIKRNTNLKDVVLQPHAHCSIIMATHEKHPEC